MAMVTVLCRELHVRYHWLLCPDGREEIFQYPLPGSLKEICHHLHQNHIYPGIESTLEQVRQLCYGLRMDWDIRDWHQRWEHCILVKNTHPQATMGHLSAAEPNQIISINITFLEPAQDGQVSCDDRCVFKSSDNPRLEGFHCG